VTELTEAEHKAVTLAGELFTHLARQVVGTGPTREADLRELAAHIHGIQHTVMSQAAARLYPGTYRLLGEVLRPEPPATSRIITIPADPEPSPVPSASGEQS
jgi:hypothetical protein